MKKIVRLCKNLAEANAAPSSIALGFATGTLIAILPTPGFGIFIALLLALVCKKISKIGIVAAFSVWNPLILIPIYWLCYALGDSVFTPDPSIQYDYALINQIYHHSGKFLIGNLFIAFLGAFVSYYGVLYFISLRNSKSTSIKTFKLYWNNQLYKFRSFRLF